MASTNRIFFSNLFVGFSVSGFFSDRRNIFNRKFCGWICPSTFRNAILNVVFLSSKKQMIWSYAWRIVASMKHVKSFWNWTKMYFPRITMGKTYFTSPCNRSMTVVSPMAFPYPTTLGFINESPKSSNRIYEAFLRTVETMFPVFVVENFSAGETFELHLKPFLSGVKEANGLHRWLPLPKFYLNSLNCL